MSLNKGKLGKKYCTWMRGSWIVKYVEGMVMDCRQNLFSFKNLPATACLPQGAGDISEEAKMHNYGITT